MFMSKYKTVFRLCEVVFFFFCLTTCATIKENKNEPLNYHRKLNKYIKSMTIEVYGFHVGFFFLLYFSFISFRKHRQTGRHWCLKHSNLFWNAQEIHITNDYYIYNELSFPLRWIHCLHYCTKSRREMFDGVLKTVSKC